MTSFEIRQESAIMLIPKNLRNLRMREMNELWGGDWRETLRKLAEKTLEDQNAREKEKFENAVQQVVEDKRKRRVGRAEERSGLWLIDWLIGKERTRHVPLRPVRQNQDPCARAVSTHVKTSGFR